MTSLSAASTAGDAAVRAPSLAVLSFRSVDIECHERKTSFQELERQQPAHEAR